MLSWNHSQLGRTPEEIDAYCQVRGDAQATEYCLWNWQVGYTDHAACFSDRRRSYKLQCVQALLAQENGGLVPGTPPPLTPPPAPAQSTKFDGREFVKGLVVGSFIGSAILFVWS